MLVMESIGNIPVPNLTDREILLLTYQQLQTVSDEFRSYKVANDRMLHELDHRIAQIEGFIATSDALKQAADNRTKRQVTIIGFVITGVNLAVSVIVQYLLRR
jgi:hypothetical protein